MRLRYACFHNLQGAAATREKVNISLNDTPKCAKETEGNGRKRKETEGNIRNRRKRKETEGNGRKRKETKGNKRKQKETKEKH